MTSSRTQQYPVIINLIIGSTLSTMSRILKINHGIKVILCPEMIAENMLSVSLKMP